MMSGVPIPSQFAAMGLDLWSPKRSVVVDMVMVQLISLVLLMLGVLVFRANELSTNEATFYLVGLFGSMIFLSAVYARISRM
jgi:alpha-ketoglutarate-dependent taurine dioxygenase|tara:strand:- start:167 stop:412 length:246 start_codon:yes stop_codon:yes gene_type:complete